MTRITAGEARASNHSRAAASPGTLGRVITASAMTRNALAPTSVTRKGVRAAARRGAGAPACEASSYALLRRSELGATAAPVANEPQHTPAVSLVERDAPVAIGAFVAGLTRPDHAD